MKTDHQKRQQMLIVCLVIIIMTIIESSEFIDLLPNDPEGLVGHDLHLWCSLRNDSRDSKDLTFSILYRKGQTHQLRSTDSVVLNRTTAMVTITNLTDGHDQANVFCWFGGEAVFQVIGVGRKPVKPNIVYYRFLNWETFVFGWKIEPNYNGFETKYTAWFKSSTDADFTPCNVLKCEPNRMSICIRQNKQNCTVPEAFLSSARKDGFIYFKVNGTNKAGTVTTENVATQLECIVEPGPVMNLTIRSKNNSDEVIYQRPEAANYLHIKFHAVSKENPKDKRELKHISIPQSKKKLQYKILNGLEPYVEYQLSTQVEYRVPPSLGGYYNGSLKSKWTNVTFISHEEVPSQAPEVCRGCFEKESGKLRLYFKPLTRKQSRGIASYTLRFQSLSSLRYKEFSASGNRSLVMVPPLKADDRLDAGELQRSYDYGDASFQLSNISMSMAYQLEIFANTSVGRGPSTFIEIPANGEMPLPPTNCTVMTVDDNSERVIVRWNNTNTSNLKLETYAVFWCIGSMNRMICKDPLEWKEVGVTDSSVSVKLKGGLWGYMFGIAATTADGRSSGIQWSCSFYDKTSLAFPPHIYPSRIDETVIEMQLEAPHYSPNRGFVYGYNLYYTDREDESDDKLVKIYLDDRITRGIVGIDGLTRGKSYRFMAESLTLAGPSSLRTTRNLTTKPFSFSTAQISGLVTGLVFLCMLAVVGCVCCLRCPLQIRKWIRLQPCTPEVVSDESNNKEQDLPAYPDYCAVGEFSANYYHFKQQNEGEIDSDMAWKDSELASDHNCFSDSDRSMIISHQLSSSGSTPTNILPLVQDHCAKPSQVLQVVDSSFPERFDDLFGTDSGNTISYIEGSEAKERTLAGKIVPNNSNHSGDKVSLLLRDSEEVDRLLPNVTEHQDPKSSLRVTTQITINNISPESHSPISDLLVFDSTLSTLPHLSSFVLPSVNSNERTNISNDENVLPRINTDLVKSTDCNSPVDLQGPCHVSSEITADIQVFADNSRETGDGASSTERFSEYSSNSDEAAPLSETFVEVTNASISNADDEGIYL